MNCSKCGSFIEEGNRFCSQCGAPVEEKKDIEAEFDKTVVIPNANYIPITPKKTNPSSVLYSTRCDECGEMLTADMNVCPRCGNVIKEQEDGLLETETTVLTSTINEETDFDATVVLDKNPFFTAPNTGTFMKETSQTTPVKEEPEDDPFATVIVDDKPSNQKDDPFATVFADNKPNSPKDDPFATVNVDNKPSYSPSPQIVAQDTCPRCGAKQEKGLRFCQACGSSMQPPVQTVAPKKSGFCMKCGSPLDYQGNCPKCSTSRVQMASPMGNVAGGNALVAICNSPVTIALLGVVTVSLLISVISAFSNFSIASIFSLALPIATCVSGWLIWANARQNKNSQTPFTIINVSLILKMIGGAFTVLIGFVLGFIVMGIDDDAVFIGILIILILGGMGALNVDIYYGLRKINEQVKNYALGYTKSIGKIRVPFEIFVIMAFSVIGLFMMLILNSVISQYLSYIESLLYYQSGVRLNLSSYFGFGIFGMILSVAQWVCLFLVLCEIGKHQYD